MSLPAFLRTPWWGEADMTLYYVFLRVWVHLGDREFWLRSLSALLGVSSIAATYALGKRFLSRRTGLVAAVLQTVQSYHSPLFAGTAVLHTETGTILVALYGAVPPDQHLDSNSFGPFGYSHWVDCEKLFTVYEIRLQLIQMPAGILRHPRQVHSRLFPVTPLLSMN